jgi:hypothetical protein
MQALIYCKLGHLRSKEEIFVLKESSLQKKIKLTLKFLDELYSWHQS